MGSSVYYQCSECGFDSGELGVGIGLFGIEVIALSCATCRTIFTSRVDPESVSNDHGTRSPHPFGEPIETPCNVCDGPLILMRTDTAGGF